MNLKTLSMMGALLFMAGLGTHAQKKKCSERLEYPITSVATGV